MGVFNRRTVIGAALVVALIYGSPLTPTYLGGRASASGASTPACTASVATLSVTTDHARYLAGTPVRITVALHNHSSSACTFATGPTSPTYQLTNAAGVTVWGSCWAGGVASPCADFLVQRTLGANATSLERFSWDQRSGMPDRLVPAGRYRFSVSLQGLGASATIVLARVRTVSLNAADSGRRYIVNVGDRVSLSLAVTGVFRWSDVQTSDPAVLAIVNVPTLASVTVFQARRGGLATITATGNPSCYPQCLMPSRLLRITIVVRVLTAQVTRDGSAARG